VQCADTTSIAHIAAAAVVIGTVCSAEVNDPNVAVTLQYDLCDTLLPAVGYVAIPPSALRHSFHCVIVRIDVLARTYDAEYDFPSSRATRPYIGSAD
jgi:hypothetical protein